MSQEQVVPASLLNIVVGPVSPRFNIGMDNWIDYDLLSDSAHSNSQESRKRSTGNDSNPQLCKKPALALANEPCPLRHFGLQKPQKRRLTNMQSSMFQRRLRSPLIGQSELLETG